MQKDIERRFAAVDVELRESEGESPEIRGEAAVFNEWSGDLGGFRERIAPGAFTEVLKTSDVTALFNHDPNMILGRQSADTLELSESDKALEFRIKPVDTSVARDTVVNIKAGNVQGNSFAFTVAEDEWDKLDDDLPERTIVRVGSLIDVGPVTFPAYEATTVSARARDRLEELQKPPEPKGRPLYREQSTRLRLAKMR